MIIDKEKHYRTRDGREVRIYATDGQLPNVIHGAYRDGDKWSIISWSSLGECSFSPGYSLVEVDPHGILPRHRELLARQLAALMQPNYANEAFECAFENLSVISQAALIALAKLDAEKSK